MSGLETEGRPDISVIVASWSGEDSVSRCLDSLYPQCECASAEVIVATKSAAAVAARLKERYPTVRFVHGGPGSSVFELRALGAEEARGRLVALTEDHATVSPQWVETMCAAHDEGHGVIGGPVDNGLERRGFDWALYFCEYGWHMPPVADGPVSSLSGINVAYDCRLLAGCRAAWEGGLFESEIHDVLRASDQTLRLLPQAWVRSHLPMGLGEAMTHLLAGGRHFGRYRRSRSPQLVRWMLILASPAIPVVLLSRIVRRIASRQPKRLLKLLWGLPYVLLLLGAWSAGEAMGYVRHSSSHGAAEPAREG